jgi:hypothetical protein
MTQFATALDAELGKDRATIFGALMLDIGEAEIRLIDGSAEIEIEGDVYAGEHALCSWGDLGEFEDGVGDDAPRITVTLLPSSDEAAAELTDPAHQGSDIAAALCARDDTTGLLIGEPYWFFAGEVNIPRHIIGRTRVELDCAGGQELMFIADEGIRLAQSWHEQVWPGELGFSHVTGITDIDYWGMEQ